MYRHIDQICLGNLQNALPSFETPESDNLRDKMFKSNDDSALKKLDTDLDGKLVCLSLFHFYHAVMNCVLVYIVHLHRVCHSFSASMTQFDNHDFGENEFKCFEEL